MLERSESPPPSFLKIEAIRPSKTLIANFRLYDITSHKTTIDIFTVVITTNLRRYSLILEN
jgi:hypothetical protein